MNNYDGSSVRFQIKKRCKVPISGAPLNFFGAVGVGLEVLFDEEEVDDDDQWENHAHKWRVIEKAGIVEAIDAKDY